jgi:hypothetical protein
LCIQCPHHQIPGQLLPFFVLYSLFNKINFFWINIKNERFERRIKNIFVIKTYLSY